MTRAGLLLSAAGLVPCAFAALTDRIEPLAAGWLAAVVLCLGLSLGAMGLGHIHALTGGRWGEVLRPVLRSLALLLPAGLILILPLLAAPELIFPWVAPAEPLPEVVRAKATWLNLPFLYARLAVCAAVWLALALRFATGARGSAEAVLSLLLLALTASVFDIDWLMGIEPEFYSTIHPPITLVAMLLGALSVGLLVFARTAYQRARADGLGKLVFGVLLLWAYLHYMQWLIVWAADLPHEISWYLVRVRQGWVWLLAAGVAVNSAVAVALAWQRVRQRRTWLEWTAAALVAGHAMDVAWRVMLPLPGPGWAMAGGLVLAVGLWLTAAGLVARWRARAGEARHV